MRRWSDALAGTTADPRGAQRYQRWMFVYWGLFGLFMVAMSFGHRAWAVPGPTGSYESPARIAGLPLFAYGPHARGIVAMGGLPVGVVAIGGLPIGVIAFGGVAVGGVAVAGVAAGIFAVGGCALGGWAIGGLAVGHCALGGLAVGRHAYAGGGVALGFQEAHGRQHERLLG
jgi:hypothetical protein